MSPWRSALRATSEGEQHAPARRLEGQQAPKTKSRGAGMPWGMHQKRAEPYGAPGPCQTWRAMAAHCTETGLDKPGRKSDGMDRGGRHAGPQGNLPDPGEQWGSHTAWQGHAAAATSSMLLASSLVNTGEPARDVKAGGAEAWGNPDATPRPTRQSKRAEESAGGEGAHRAKALRARGGKQDKGPQRTRQAVHGACPAELAQGTFPIISLWREPYEANVSRTGLTGGMGRRAVRERALILPTWPGWHHHMALSLIAVWFLIVRQVALKRK